MFILGFYFAQWLHTREVELLSPCVCLDAGRTLWICIQTGGYCIFQVCSSWVLPHCCHFCWGLQSIRSMHVIITSFAFLNHSTLLTFLSCDVDVLCWLGLQKDLRWFLGGKIALLSALCMFFKASEKTHSYQLPVEWWFTLFLFLPHLCFCFFFFTHIIMQC